jgi:hypothetical protein
MAARPPTASLTASHRVRVTDWFQARAAVPVSSSRAISGAPQNRPTTAERVARVELAALIRPVQRVWGEPEPSALSVFL